MLSSTLVAVAGLFTATSAQTTKGFNYGATNTDNSPILEQQYQNDFTTAQSLVGATGFTSARLYTMIQAGTTNTPTQAIQAAINTKTSLLLGLWGSGGQTTIDNELAALKGALAQYGSAFSDLIAGISVGSEDLYRISPTGIENLSGVGAGPDVISNYIGQVRSAIAGTAASSKPVGHVDTWTAWVNSSNDAVISASDFIGMDAYPYFQTTMNNPIENGYSLFFDAYDATVSAVGGKPVWVTETGWPVSGPTENQAVPSVQNAKTYWDAVGCGRLFGKVNTWWYTLQDAVPTTPSPSFGIVGAALSDNPLYDLSCSDVSSNVASFTSASSTSDATALASSAQAGSAQAGDIPATAKIGSGNEATGQSSSSSGNNSPPRPPTSSATVGGPSKGSPPVSSSLSAPSQGSLEANSQSIVTSAALAETIVASAQAVPEAQPVTTADAALTTLITKTSVASAASVATATASSCPASLSGNFEYPHLIIPVSKDRPTVAEGTSYNGTISPVVSSIFNFDIPVSGSGKTCTLVFLLPTQEKLTTSAFSLGGSGGFDVARLSGPATESTTYSTVPFVTHDLGGPSNVEPGNEYVIESGPCDGGSRIAYEVSSTGGLDLNYFQDSNPSPIGFYITVC